MRGLPSAASVKHHDGSAATARRLAAAALAERNGDRGSAVEHYRCALAVDPACAAAWNNLGNLFASIEDWATALTFLRQAASLAPQDAAVCTNLAHVLEQSGATGEAFARYTAAVHAEPENASYRNHLGDALQRAGDVQAAERELRHALALQPGFTAAMLNLAFVLYQQGRLPEAESMYRRALALEPGCAQAHVCLAQILLAGGHFAEGWREQEWRWRWKGFRSPKRHFTMPQWRGEPLQGKSIVLHAEQGLGDAIQFVRFVPMVAALGARVVLEVHPALLELMRAVQGVDVLLGRGSEVPECDWHCPLLSLPLAFGTTLETVPTAGPGLLYRGPDRPAWISKGDLAVRAGLVWAGNPENQADRKRSIPFDLLAPLLQVQGVDFYSFQLNADVTADRRFQGQLPASTDLSETATALCAMDVVISVDTAVAHLAGTLQVPVWVLLPFVADWRWLERRADSPWYPTATLFRQQADRQWEPVLAEVADALGAWRDR